MAHDIAESIVKMAEMRVEEDKAKWKEAFIAKCRKNRYIVEFRLNCHFDYTREDGTEAHDFRFDQCLLIVYNVDGKLYLDMTDKWFGSDSLASHYTGGINDFVEPDIQRVVAVDSVDELEDYTGSFEIDSVIQASNRRNFKIRAGVEIFDGTDEAMLKDGCDSDNWSGFYWNGFEGGVDDIAKLKRRVFECAYKLLPKLTML